jgi:hypothetical protein
MKKALAATAILICIADIIFVLNQKTVFVKTSARIEGQGITISFKGVKTTETILFKSFHPFPIVPFVASSTLWHKKISTLYVSNQGYYFQNLMYITYIDDSVRFTIVLLGTISLASLIILLKEYVI